MNPYLNEDYNAIREGVRALCAEFPAEYWRKIDEQKGFPEAFVTAMTEAGWLSAMIPLEYGGSGLGLAEASVILEEVNHCGGNSGTVHGQIRPQRRRDHRQQAFGHGVDHAGARQDSGKNTHNHHHRHQA